MSYHRKSQQKALRGAVGTVQRAADLDVEVPRCTRELGFSSHSSSAGTCIVPPMSWVPAGSFVMGSDRTVDPKAYRDETPQHEARTIAFCMGTYPVTVAEYALAVQQGVAAEPRDFKGITWRGQLRSPDHPVTSISWLMRSPTACGSASSWARSVGWLRRRNGRRPRGELTGTSTPGGWTGIGNSRIRQTVGLAGPWRSATIRTRPALTECTT